MRTLWIAGGGLSGLMVGSAFGFAAALAVASLRPSPNDGTFGMREILIGLPSGAVLGLIVGVALAYRHAT